MKDIKMGLYTASVLLIMFSCAFIWKGFDYKINYVNSDSILVTNKNAYVGGDAYNYIINGTYFTGFMVLGGASALSGIELLCTALIIEQKDDMEIIEKETMNTDGNLF